MLAFQLFSCRREGASRAGSVASEFALIVPLLTTLMLGVIEFGTVFFSYSAMQFAAHDAARQMAVNVANQATALAAASNFVPGWARDHVTMSVTQSNAADPSQNIIRVRVVADAGDMAVMSVITRLVPMTLTADASIKQELPYVD